MPFFIVFTRAIKLISILKKLINDKKMNFSRYNYFYANFLINSGRVKDAEKIINSSLKLYPRNVLLKQFKIDLQNKNC